MKNILKIPMIFLIMNFSFAYDDYNVSQIASDLGITLSDYNFLMGLTGLLVGFLILFFVILFIKD